MRRRALVAIALIGLVTACGFQLRGEARLPAAMDRTWIAAADESSVFVRELGLLLEANGVERLIMPAEDAATLRIDGQSLWRQPLSVSGQARVREYLLVFEVTWRLESAGGEVLIERDTLRLTRDYSFDENEILAAQREEEFLRDDLSRSMASRLLRRLEVLGDRDP
jgi:LPS-assembly lipoprotein